MTAFELREPTEHGPHYSERQDRYLLRLPGTPKARTFTRATTFVKAIDNSGALADWQSTMAITGVLTDTAVRAEWAALLADAGGDPWYRSDATKERAKGLVKRAQEAGGSKKRAETGTALHAVLESVATGRARPGDVLEEFRPFVANALALLDAEGLDIVPELCERTVYVERFDVVGRFDLMLRRRTDGRLLKADWKTGGVTWKPKRHWKTKEHESWRDGYEDSDRAHAAQLALYTMADALITWPADKWDECIVEPYPTDQVDPTIGVIIHLPSTEGGVASLRYLDLTVGRELLEVAAGVRATSKAKPLIQRVGAIEPPLPGAAPAEQPATQAGAPAEASATDERRAWIVARVTRLVEHPELGGELAALWPLPGVRASQVTTDAEVDAIAAACLAVEAQHLAVYDVPDPALPAAATRSSVVDDFVVRVATIDADAEGRDVAPGDSDALVGLLRSLDAAQLAVVDAVASEASAAGVGLSLRYRFDGGGERPLTADELVTFRRWMLARALWACAAAGIGHEDLRDALYLATGRLDARQLTIPVGAIFGTLTTAEAERLARLGQRLHDGTAVVTYAADGLPVVDDATRAALAA